MDRSSETASSQHTPEHFLGTLAVRSYRRIAEVLTARGSPSMTPARVEHICREAELKIVHALLADPVTRERLYPGAAPGDRATQSGERIVHEER